MTLGERIRHARKRAGLSMRDLAAQVEVSAQAISNYERGEDTPRAAVLLQLARVLQVSTEFFFRKTEVQLTCPQYRKTSRFGVKDREAALERIREQLERYLDLESLFPPNRFGPLALTPRDVRPIRNIDAAEAIAAELRQRWELGTDPIEPLAEALEDRGIKVLLIEAPEGFDGLACWANGEIPVVVANANKPWDRQRFDLAHELGELILSPDPDVDRERAAHRFAGAFLVPREAVVRKLGPQRARLDLEELRLLKQEYGLSMQAWGRRALDTGVISATTYETLCKRFTALGLRRDEGTAHREPERARRFELLVYQAEAEGLITAVRAAALRGQIPKPSRAPVTDDELRAAVAAAQRYYATDPDEAELAAFVGDDMADGG